MLRVKRWSTFICKWAFQVWSVSSSTNRANSTPGSDPLRAPPPLSQSLNCGLDKCTYGHPFELNMCMLGTIHDEHKSPVSEQWSSLDQRSHSSQSCPGWTGLPRSLAAIHTAPNPHGPTYRWWACWKGDPCHLFWLCPIGIDTSHQALTIKPHPQCLDQKGFLDWLTWLLYIWS